jgi:hypothetical protein
VTRYIDNGTPVDILGPHEKHIYAHVGGTLPAEPELVWDTDRNRAIEIRPGEIQNAPELLARLKQAVAYLEHPDVRNLGTVVSPLTCAAWCREAIANAERTIAALKGDLCQK